VVSSQRVTCDHAIVPKLDIGNFGGPGLHLLDGIVALDRMNGVVKQTNDRYGIAMLVISDSDHRASARFVRPIQLAESVLLTGFSARTLHLARP
jgi:hypothetical protein